MHGFALAKNPAAAVLLSTAASIGTLILVVLAPAYLAFGLATASAASWCVWLERDRPTRGTPLV